MILGLLVGAAVSVAIGSAVRIILRDYPRRPRTFALVNLGAFILAWTIVDAVTDAVWFFVGYTSVFVIWAGIETIRYSRVRRD